MKKQSAEKAVAPAKAKKPRRRNEPENEGKTFREVVHNTWMRGEIVSSFTTRQLA